MTRRIPILSALLDTLFLGTVSGHDRRSPRAGPQDIERYQPRRFRGTAPDISRRK